MSIEIVPVHTKNEMTQFIKFPWKIYSGNPNWVPPLLSEQKKMFSKQRSPFFEHSDAEFFLAKRNGEITGRIAAIKNNNHLKVYNDGVGFFGFFEAINDRETAHALFEKAAAWLKKQGLKYIRGPENYSQNETAGLLIDAFDQPPVIEMTYNPPYYIDLIESAGFKKKMDLYAYSIKDVNDIPNRLARAVKKIRKSADFTVREINMKKLDEDVKRVKLVYNAAWAENWGAVPLTDNEIEDLKNNLKPVIIPDMALIAEIDGNPVGVSFTIPDINEALIKLRSGRLFPFGIFKLLWYNRKITGTRTVIMGVLKEHRHKGIDIVFYYETFKNGLRRGFNKGEMSWILENNLHMRRALEKIYGTHIAKTYRLFEKEM
ncbi:MAG TPA: N-acetyltransferase [Candidatus Marinimicrobia bacterium]|nr:N-acetyltransferase [Candidatus Neomarinimicrobiota bacterium]